jgi:NAD(P)-dependent dehydrogenase (short-subunit alcohol dehydrogenase family)
MADQKRYIVTGAAGNVGSALTGLLAGRGHRVAAIDRDLATLAARFAAWPAVLPLAVADLSDPAAAGAVVGQAASAFGGLDGVAATVGIFDMASVAESGPELWQRMLKINVLTALNVFAPALPHLRAGGGGGLVAISAGAALRAPAGMSAYAAAKSAVLRLVESLAEEAKADRIRVNAVLPGTIDTPQNRAAMPGADPARWVTPAQVAEVMAFLLSDEAGGVTGAAVGVPGLG